MSNTSNLYVAVTMAASAYVDPTVSTVAPLAVEIVDHTRVPLSTVTSFVNPNNSSAYVKAIVNIPQAYRKTIINNYADPVTGGCLYVKASGSSAASLTPQYVTVNNRNLTSSGVAYLPNTSSPLENY